MPTVAATTHTSVTRSEGEEWVIGVCVLGPDGLPTGTGPSIAVTSPTGVATAPTAESVDGRWVARVVLDEPGRWVARVTAAGGGARDFTAWAGTIVPAAGMPDVDELSGFLRDHSYETADLERELASEAAAQRARCRVPADYPPDLRKALLRRAQRALAMNGLPYAMPQTDAENGPAVLPMNDPEVRRLEMPYRRIGTFG